MGSSVSHFPDPVKIAASPETTSSADKSAPLATPGAPTPEAEKPMFNNCWSCRVLSGLGLIGAGGYVYWVAKKPMKMGYAPGPGIIAQMTIGISIACWGVVILTDPKGKAFRVA
ncbi:distal membrane-arm assembly complex protein 1 [Suncus etruscus]|uniref:distal membrane-arm assembly complex protein 1 n=1 Tax=Suncus etruscus TaxID=109475 RepID=UPI00210FC189|nr:distal membrane-arm assembly complex protein 1 [Suncus etruscus]